MDVGGGRDIFCSGVATARESTVYKQPTHPLFVTKPNSIEWVTESKYKEYRKEPTMEGDRDQREKGL